MTAPGMPAIKCDNASYDVPSRHTAITPILAALSVVLIQFAPVPAGIVVSNCFCSSGLSGALGSSGTVVGAAAGSTMYGVTITISSEFVRFTDLDRNSCPNIGISPIPGTLENCAVVL